MTESLNVDIILEEDTPNIDVDVESQAATFSEILRNDTLIGDGIDTPLGVNTNAISTVDTLNQGLATKQDKGDYATNTRVNQVAASIPEAYDDTEIRNLIDNVEETSEHAKAIAEGKATGYVFDTVEDMNAWVGTNSSILKLGDNLYIRAVNVPDYWWDGEKAQQLETQKVDLSEYVKNTDYATGSKAGIAKINLAYGININNQTLTIFKATDNEVKGKGNLYRPIVPANLDLAVKTGVTTNTIELTDDEKTSARTWLGAVGNTDYATSTTAGVIKAQPTYGLVQYSGILQGQTRNLASYNSAMNSFVVCKGTLENVLTQYSKTVLTTEADYNALETKDANTLYLIEE